MLNTYNNNIYKKLLGSLIKKGKKSVAQKLLIRSFLKVSLFAHQPIFRILIKLFLRLNTYVETRVIKVRRSRYVVPFPISLKRRLHLCIKWFLASIFVIKDKNSFVDKCSKQLILILKNSKSEAIRLKRLNITQATLNLSNIHFRW